MTQAGAGSMLTGPRAFRDKLKSRDKMGRANSFTNSWL